MTARKRLLSLPLQAEISHHDKYDDVTKDPHFLWSARKVSVNRRMFWTVKQCLGLTVSPVKVTQTSQKKLPPNISSRNSIRSSNSCIEYPVNRNKDLTLIEKALSRSPCVLKESITSRKSKLSENSKVTGAVTSAKKIPSARETVSCKNKRRKSVIFVEEIITLDDLEFSDEEPIETHRENQRAQKKASQESEYKDYLRLKAKFEGRMKNRIREETRMVDLTNE